MSSRTLQTRQEMNHVTTQFKGQWINGRKKATAHAEQTYNVTAGGPNMTHDSVQVLDV